ncbi:MAG: hypothetical protein QM785_04115 [Pyrinomonadaceae bacterium]
MRKVTELNPEIFEALLGAFSADRDEAGRRYEAIRKGLIRFFYFRGCDDAEALADETISRVAAKIGEYDPEKTPKIASYFNGFAANVAFEYRRERVRELPIADEATIAAKDADEAVDEYERLECLKSCMKDLDISDRQMIVEYYGSDGKEKTEARRNLCETFGLSPGALHTRIFRIRAQVRKCVEKCLAAA